MLPIHFQHTRHRVVSLVLSIFLVTLAPAANAVTKHLSMIGENGQPLASTMITITAPDGSTAQKSTDDKAILEHNFSKAGVYTLSDPSGNVIKTISVAGSGFGSKAMTITAVSAGALLLLAAGASSGDSGADEPAPAPPPAPPEDDPVDPDGSLAGKYNVTATIASNPRDLPVLIDTLVLQLEIIGTALTIIQVSSNQDFPAELAGTIVDNSFSASATGVYDESETLFQLAGSVSISGGMSFLINIGSDGSLPGGEAITYNATGTKE